MTIDTRAELERALAEAHIGMSGHNFVRLVARILREVGRPATAEPASQLTTDELTQLRRGGLQPSTDGRRYDRVRASTAAQTAALLASSLSTAETARLLGVDPSRVRQLLAEGSLLGAKDEGGWRILRLQFAGDRLLPGIGAVARAMSRDVPLLVQARFLSSPTSDLEIDGRPVTPLEWLAAGGDPAPVSALAAEL